jgi:predicted nucleic acid-binding protein
MIAKTFVDSNILIYAHDLDAGDRQQSAAECLAALWGAGAGVLSTQVLQEFYVTVTRKIKFPLSHTAARQVVRAYAPWAQSLTTPEMVARASEIGEIWQLSFWDSLILAAAEQSQAVELLTEDLNHGQVIAGIRVVNPFLRGRLTA